jgi:hypothetical protein
VTRLAAVSGQPCHYAAGESCASRACSTGWILGGNGNWLAVPPRHALDPTDLNAPTPPASSPPRRAGCLPIPDGAARPGPAPATDRRSGSLTSRSPRGSTAPVRTLLPDRGGADRPAVAPGADPRPGRQSAPMFFSAISLSASSTNASGLVVQTSCPLSRRRLLYFTRS